MKSATRHFLQISGLALWLIFGLAITAEAQNREKYIISAQAGGINFVSGNVTVRRLGERSPRALVLTDNLQTGDSVTTGAGGRVEVLLNPGSYLRLDENSEFELTDASLDNLLVSLKRGSAVMEVTGASDVELALGVNTPQAEALITKGGIYRFNALPNETTEISVRKGRVVFGKGTQTKLKGGQKALIGRAGVEVAKLNKKDQDTLDLWSKERAETLARANRRLERRSLLLAFNDYGWADMSWWGQTSPRYGSLGLWVYSANTRSYCFLPMGPTAWSTPYGQSYGTGLGGYGYGFPGPRGLVDPLVGSRGN
ncbi:MAG TPA: FecR family protein, partial [Pyrinomonadaceae bacterium]